MDEPWRGKQGSILGRASQLIRKQDSSSKRSNKVNRWAGGWFIDGIFQPSQPGDLLVFVQLSLHAPLPPHIALLIRPRIEINLDILTRPDFHRLCRLIVSPSNSRFLSIIGRLYVSYFSSSFYNKSVENKNAQCRCTKLDAKVSIEKLINN